MGLILDIVPNHMAADDANRFWADPELRASASSTSTETTGRHRRFFDIDELAGVRQEDPEVFDATHALVLRWSREGVVDGLRIDHPDGLADPRGYLRRLRDGGAEHVWVEKILDPGERAARLAGRGHGRLRVRSTTSTALFVDPAAEAPLTALWRAHRRRGGVRGARRTRPSSSRRTTTFAPEVERLRRGRRRAAGSSEALAVAAGLPDLRRAATGRRRRGPRRRSPGASAAGARGCARRGGADSRRASSRPRRR